MHINNNSSTMTSSRVSCITISHCTHCVHQKMQPNDSVLQN